MANTVVNGNGSNVAGMRGRRKREVPAQGNQNPCAAMAEAGNIAGVLGWLRSRSVLDLPPDALDHLAKAVRNGQANLDGLVDTAFGEVIGFIIVLLVRCQLHVERRLAEADRLGGDPTHLPSDLDGDGWLARIERVSRFLLEVTAARTRTNHVGSLNRETRKAAMQHSLWFDSAAPVAADRSPTVPGQGPSRNGRSHREAGQFKFP